MKRPRWLGSGEPEEQGSGDEDSAAESATDEAGEESGTPSAAERSARRTARKALGARVAADVEPPTEKPKASKPKRAARKPERTEKPKAENPMAKKPGGKDEAAPAAKKLHRPRPQKGTERTKPGARSRGESDERTTEGAKDRGKEEKEKRKPLGPRVRAGAVASATALKQGAVATRKQVAVSTPKLGRRVLAGLAAFYAVFFAGLGFALRILIAVGIVIARPIRWVLVRLQRLTNAASRIATPTRVLALVVAGAAILLALSQYADYRSIAIGNDAYSGVQTVAPPPETGRLPTGDAHSYLFVPIAIACLVLLGVALTGRWRLCRLISLAGVAAVVVAIVVDRPAGLDIGDTALAFDGVRATLLGGFYAQIAAGILLTGSSALLGRELRLAGAAERARPEPGRKRRERRSTVPPPADTGGVRA